MSHFGLEVPEKAAVSSAPKWLDITGNKRTISLDYGKSGDPQNARAPTMPSLDRLIVTSLREDLIDQYSVDQDGSNVIVIGQDIHYLSDSDAEEFLLKLLRAKGVFTNKDERNKA